MRRILCTIALLIGLFYPAFAQDFEAGNIVVLVERDIHIPAHPAPSDNRVPFRFTGGSVAHILSIDPESGWLEIRGEPVGGGEAIGWIAESYIKELANSEPPELAWCPQKGSPDPHPSGRLRIATWNLGNLHASNGQATFTGSYPSVKRSSIDYQRIRCYVRLFDPDILAVQEVDGEEALQRIVDTDVYNIHVSERPKPDFMNAKQNTGFAYKKGLNVEEQDDFEDLDVSNGTLRYGTRIDVTHSGQTFLLMSVHLKSGCFGNDNSGSACDRLLSQVPVLEAWIDEAAQGAHPFIVLGDFNRRFNLADDLVWTDLDDAQPTNADLTAVTEDRPLSCRDNKYTTFIDHIVFGKRSIEFVDRSSFRHMTFRQADKEVWDMISDHCPVVVEMWVP